MKRTKIIAMYLPQYHRIPENDLWWGEGFTDWVSAKNATPLFKMHNQPKIPLDDNYYDLADVNAIKWQADLARSYGIDGFGIYHYWFSSSQKLLTTPAELLLQNKEINIPFFFAWDNCSWVRTWSKLKHNTNAWSPKFDKQSDDAENGMLAELKYGDKTDWEIHFNYLLPFFLDQRYIKVDNKPVFIFFNYYDKTCMGEMIKYWHKLAKENGFDGMYIMSRENPYDGMMGLDGLFSYEPMFTAWQNKNIFLRVYAKMAEKFRRKNRLQIFNYDRVWQSIIRHARRNHKSKLMYGGFVNYDDTPRRGNRGKIVYGGTPEKFQKYLDQLYSISQSQGKEFIFLTAWNEWGEGAYLEPDTTDGYAYLEAVKAVKERHEKDS